MKKEGVIRLLILIVIFLFPIVPFSESSHSQTNCDIYGHREWRGFSQGINSLGQGTVGANPVGGDFADGNDGGCCGTTTFGQVSPLVIGEFQCIHNGKCYNPGSYLDIPPVDGRDKRIYCTGSGNQLGKWDDCDNSDNIFTSRYCQDVCNLQFIEGGEAALVDFDTPAKGATICCGDDEFEYVTTDGPGPTRCCNDPNKEVDASGTCVCKQGQVCHDDPPAINCECSGNLCHGSIFGKRCGGCNYINLDMPNLQVTQGMIGLGARHSCAVKVDGTVYCWGKNTYGQLGDGSKDDSDIPVKVTDINNAVSVSGGDRHTCVLLSNKQVKCWGSGVMLGEGTTTQSLTPVTVLKQRTFGNSPLTDIVKISAGNFHTCAKTTSNSIECWGVNTNAQLGKGDIRIFPNIQLGILAKGTNNYMAYSTTFEKRPGYSPATELSAGYYSTCITTTSQSFPLQCWGRNKYRQIPHKDTTAIFMNPRNFAIANIVKPASGWFHSCGIFSDGSVKCWGNPQSYHILGPGVTDTGYEEVPTTVTGVINAVEISAGRDHSCALISDGTITCWGSSGRGQLGFGKFDFGSGTPLVKKVQGITNAIGISAGEAHTCAILEDATVKCWGRNDNGQLGNGEKNNANVPVTVENFLAGWGAEVCDTIDNDCNGVPDDGDLCGPGNECQNGACVTSCECSDTTSCQTGGTGRKCGGCEFLPTLDTEICDGVDNDCDGNTDEGVTNACGTCGPVPVEVCDGIDNDCDGQKDEGLLNACGTCGQLPLEVCDGVDNDCDGKKDENLVCCGNGNPDKDGTKISTPEVCDSSDPCCNNDCSAYFPPATVKGTACCTAPGTKDETPLQCAIAGTIDGENCYISTQLKSCSATGWACSAPDVDTTKPDCTFNKDGIFYTGCKATKCKPNVGWSCDTVDLTSCQTSCPDCDSNGICDNSEDADGDGIPNGLDFETSVDDGQQCGRADKAKDGAPSNAECVDKIDNDGDSLPDNADPACTDGCSSCDTCGAGIFNFCLPKDCSNCGDCLFNPFAVINRCVVDSDQDDDPDSTDCQPNNNAVHKDAIEICDNIDNNCKGGVDEINPSTPLCNSGFTCSLGQCLISDLEPCQSDDECVNKCIHNICRATDTFCGDGFCDTGEICDTDCCQDGDVSKRCCDFQSGDFINTPQGCCGDDAEDAGKTINIQGKQRLCVLQGDQWDKNLWLGGSVTKADLIKHSKSRKFTEKLSADQKKKLRDSGLKRFTKKALERLGLLKKFNIKD